MRRDSIADQLMGVAVRLLRSALAPPSRPTMPRSLEAIRELSWEEFERLMVDFYRRQGYRVVHTGSPMGDGGVDLRLHRDGVLTVVQCKQWKAWKVGAPRVRDLYGAMMHEGAESAVLVTSGRFTGPAKQFAHGKPIRLIAGDELARMVTDVPAESPTTGAPDSPFARASGTESTSSATPVCPKCGSAMVTRVAKRGQHAGRRFWGCTRFPKCWGRRAYEN